MTHIAKQRGVRVLLDGAQAVAHRPVDVQALNCDFYVFSSHKLYGPTGLGVLYGRHDLLNAMPPYQGGGDMIQAVSLAQSTFQQAPHRFEAGTPNIAAVLGLGAAIEFMQQQSWSQVMAHEAVLLQRFQQGLTQFTAARVLGQPRERSGVVSFVWRDVHAHDIGTILDQAGVAVRVGHHCAMPIMQHFKVPATTRASFGIYNTADDVDACLHALQRVEEIFHS
jgi:cysteine desulfurase/selenocysteine lyase